MRIRAASDVLSRASVDVSVMSMHPPFPADRLFGADSLNPQTTSAAPPLPEPAARRISLDKKCVRELEEA